MFQTIVNAFKIKEIRRKILITIALIFVYRLGCYIPVPGVELFDLTEVPFFSIVNMASGNALSMGTFFAMGIGPYINASIIIQLLTVAIPALERLSKQGEEGRRNRYRLDGDHSDVLYLRLGSCAGHLEMGAE